METFETISTGSLSPPNEAISYSERGGAMPERDHFTTRMKTRPRASILECIKISRITEKKKKKKKIFFFL